MTGATHDKTTMFGWPGAQQAEPQLNAFSLLNLPGSMLGRMSRPQAEQEIRSRVQTVPLGDGVILTRVLGHHKMLLRASDRGFSRHVMLDGYWESWLTIFCARVLKPGMVAFDIGANLGYYTLLFADCVGASGKVVSIEPNPSTFELLEQSVLLNGFGRNVRLVQAAAAEHDGPLDLFVPLGEPKNATVAFDGGARPAEARVSVPGASVDQLSRELERVDFFKIDVEGAEPAVIAGMSETIARFKPTIVLEFNARRYKDSAAFLGKLLDTYGVFGEIDFAGDCRRVEAYEILSDQSGEDRLLCFPGRGIEI